MSEPHVHIEYKLVIETDQYAGNFEREMCAYMTGRIGDCEVGGEQAKVAKEDLPEKVWEWCDQCIERKPDDHGCYRPVKMCDMDTTALEIYMEELPPPEIFQLFKFRAVAFGLSQGDEDPSTGKVKITVTNARMVKMTTTYLEEDVAP